MELKINNIVFLEEYHIGALFACLLCVFIEVYWFTPIIWFLMFSIINILIHILINNK